MTELKFPNSGLLFDEEEHRYYFEGRTLKSVTTLLKETLFADKYGDVDKDTLANAAKFGTTVHKLLETDSGPFLLPDDIFDVMTEIYGLSVEEMKCDGAMCAICTNISMVYEKAYSLLFGVTTLRSEYLVTDGRLAGSVDRIAYVNGEPAIVDYKFTYNADIEYLSWQESIYAYLFYKMTGQRISKAYALWVPKRNVNLGWFNEIPMKSDEDIEGLIDGAIVTKEDMFPAEINDARSALKTFFDMEKKIEEKKAQLKEKFFAYMEANGITSIDAGDYKISYVKASTRKTFDKKALEKAHPEINTDDFMKESKVSATIKFSAK